MPTMPTIPPEALRLIMTQGGLVLGLLVFYIVFKIFMLRMTIKGKVGCYFQEPTGERIFELIKYQRDPSDSQPLLISKTDKLAYLLDITLQSRTLYPSGTWRFMQESIPTQCFVRGHYFPVDWFASVDVRNPAELAVMMQNAQNTKVATDFMNLVSENASPGRIKSLQSIVLIGLLVLGVGIAAVGYLSYQNYSALNHIRTAIGK